jgi:hypothetical protein
MSWNHIMIKCESLQTVKNNSKVTQNINNENNNRNKDSIQNDISQKTKVDEGKKVIGFKCFLVQKVYFVLSSLKFSFIMLIESFLFYSLWILIHSCASNYYSDLCAPKGISGILYSSLTISSPHCSGLRWLMTRSAIAVENMWTVVGTFLSINLINKFPVHNVR